MEVSAALLDFYLSTLNVSVSDPGLRGPHPAPLVLSRRWALWAQGVLCPCSPCSGLPRLSPQTVIPFYNLSVLIALFSPRCSDAVASVRLHAVDCVYCLLYIQLCYEGEPGCGGVLPCSPHWGRGMHIPSLHACDNGTMGWVGMKGA